MSLKINKNGEQERFDALCKASTATPDSDIFHTRRGRRKALTTLIQVLHKIKEAEEIYRDNTPENLQNSAQYEDTENFIEAFEEAIEILTDTY